MENGNWISNLFGGKRKPAQDTTSTPAPAEPVAPPASAPVQVAVPLVTAPADCCLFHVSHSKAASQWMRAILKELFGPTLIEPEYGARHVWGQPVKLGHVYACANLGRPEFEKVSMPGPARCFVLIRDLRDTLVSAYYSFRNTHETSVDAMKYYRWILNSLDQEQGLLRLMETWLPTAAWIQRSWLKSKGPCIKMEECVVNTPVMLDRIFREHWGLKVEGKLLEEVSARHCFAAKSQGRAPGQQDLGSHYRKGVAGDWVSHFTPRLAERFEALYGDLLLLAGYETKPGWSRSVSKV